MSISSHWLRPARYKYAIAISNKKSFFYSDSKQRDDCFIFSRKKNIRLRVRHVWWWWWCSEWVWLRRPPMVDGFQVVTVLIRHSTLANPSRGKLKRPERLQLQHTHNERCSIMYSNDFYFNAQRQTGSGHSSPSLSRLLVVAAHSQKLSISVISNDIQKYIFLFLFFSCLSRN